MNIFTLWIKSGLDLTSFMIRTNVGKQLRSHRFYFRRDGGKGERERESKDERERSSISWFILQMATAVGSELKPGAGNMLIFQMGLWRQSAQPSIHCAQMLLLEAGSELWNSLALNQKCWYGMWVSQAAALLTVPQHSPRLLV